MAKYLTVNSTFKPFSYEELLAPALMATQAHRELEDAYSELDSQANTLGAMASEINDPVAYSRYKAFESELRAQADVLAKNGLTPNSRQSLLSLKGRYAKDITPIQNAITRRRELGDEQRKALLQDPTLMFQRDMNSIGYESSLDRFLENPEYDYGERYSGALLTKQVGTIAQNLAKEMRDNPRKWRSILGNQYFETIMQKGYRPEEIIQVLQNDPNGSLILKNIVEDVVGSSGIASWGDANILNRAYDYAGQGLWNAVGDTQYKTLQNQRYLNPLQRLQYNNLTTPKTNKIAINPLNIYSSREQDKAAFYMKQYADYFYTDADGKVKMNQKGRDEYNRKEYNPGTMGYAGNPAYYQPHPTLFRRFMDSLAKGKYDNTTDLSDLDLGDLWTQYNSDHQMDKYDASKVTEYDYSIDSSQQGDIKDAILSANRGLSLKEVDYDSESKSFKITGKEITMEDLKNDNYKVTATRFSPYGATVMIQDDKGNVRRFRMPAGINTTNEQNRDRAMAAAYQWQQMISTGQFTDAKGNIRQATPEEIVFAQQQYEQALQQAYLYHSQIGLQNKVKEQEFNPYGY